VHLPDGSVSQQLLPVLPQQFLPHLWLELDLYGFKVLQPTLRREKGVVGAKENAILQTRGSLPQQTVRNITW
jgi:hypothetical protein